MGGLPLLQGDIASCTHPCWTPVIIAKGSWGAQGKNYMYIHNV
jgi:hypothetical protein